MVRLPRFAHNDKQKTKALHPHQRADDDNKPSGLHGLSLPALLLLIRFGFPELALDEFLQGTAG